MLKWAASFVALSAAFPCMTWDLTFSEAALFRLGLGLCLRKLDMEHLLKSAELLYPFKS